MNMSNESCNLAVWPPVSRVTDCGGGTGSAGSSGPDIQFRGRSLEVSAGSRGRPAAKVVITRNPVGSRSRIPEHSCVCSEDFAASLATCQFQYESVTFGMLSEVLAFAKRQASQLPTETTTAITHNVLQKLSRKQLKNPLPQFASLQRAVRNHKLCHGTNCSDEAKCLYDKPAENMALNASERVKRHRQQQVTDEVTDEVPNKKRRLNTAHRKWRQNVDNRNAERASDRIAKQKRREIPSNRTVEKTSDRIAKQKRREIPSNRTAEKTSDRVAKQKRREIPSNRNAKRASDRIAKQKRRQNPTVAIAHRLCERARRQRLAHSRVWLQNERCRKQTQMQRKQNTGDIIRKFQIAIQSGPIYVLSLIHI